MSEPISVTSKQMSLQQQAMSFLSEGLNNGFWSRTKAQDLVRAMLDANWQQPSQVETSAPSRGSIEYAIEVLERYRDGSDPECTCDDCPQCDRLPAECSGTQCAQTCQCSECDHCRVVAAIAGLKGSSQETAAPETSCRYEAAVGSVCNKCERIHDFGPNRCAECQTPRLCGVERECLRNRYVQETKESPLGRAVRIARGDVGPPVEPVRFAEKASVECICPRRDSDDEIIYTHVACSVHGTLSQNGRKDGT